MLCSKSSLLLFVVGGNEMRIARSSEWLQLRQGSTGNEGLEKLQKPVIFGEHLTLLETELIL
jgi:hypothetical protein